MPGSARAISKQGLAGVPPSAGAARLVNEARKSHSRCRLLRCFFVPFAAVVRRSQESLKAKHHAATGNAYQMMKRTPTQLAKPLSRSNAECLEKTLGRLYPVLVEGIGGALDQSVPTHAYARGACSHALFRTRLKPPLGDSRVHWCHGRKWRCKVAEWSWLGGEDKRQGTPGRQRCRG